MERAPEPRAGSAAYGVENPGFVAWREAAPVALDDNRLDVDGVPSFSPVRRRRNLSRCLREAGPVGGPHPDQVIPLDERRVELPLQPRLVGQRRTQFALHPGTVVDLDLDPGDAVRRRPGDAAERVRTGVHLGSVSWAIDPRLSLDRPLFRPATRNPVAVECVPRCEFDFGQPLRRRHVAIPVSYTHLRAHET